MSSIIERLTEGVVNRDMKAEGHALLQKWERTGLLEGLTDDRSKNSMARLLENQAKELLRESSSMSAGDVEGFASVAFPIVRRVFAGLIANDLVSVQPMSLPSGLIFFLDFLFSPDLGGSPVETAQERLGNVFNKSIYGTDQVGSQVTGGVDLFGTLAGDFSAARTVGARGYAYASPTGSQNITSSALTIRGYSIDTLSDAIAKQIEYDPDIMALSGASTPAYLLKVQGAQSLLVFGANNTAADWNNTAPMTLAISGGGTGLTDILADATLSPSNTQQARRLTAPDGANFEMWYVTTDNTVTGASANTPALAAGSDKNVLANFPIVDDMTTGGAMGSVIGQTEWALEGTADIPEIDIKVDSIAVTAQTKKLKAKWTPELGQDLNAYHNLDAEVELTSILSEQIALEIDREILGDLVNGANAGTYYWSRSPGLFVNRTTGAEVGAGVRAPDFTGTVSEWYETLIETINDVSAQIHRKTLRGGANFIVCGPEVANILEFTAGFRASVTNDDESGTVGAVKVGSLSKKFDVIVDPYFLRNVVLVGRRGSSFLESGYVYAPYVPLQTTPTIFGPEDFVPRKGVMTRYAKQMVRPDMYGLVVVRGLFGENGGS